MRAMKLLAVLPVALVLLSVAPPADAFFHWAPWSATGVAQGASGADVVTVAYRGEIFNAFPHPVVVTLTGASSSTTTITATESITCSYTYGEYEYLCITLTAVDGSQ
ncbi:MAG: hypothetical protein LC624_03150, partial [Halobacteriales archaeon]|nr:hypothetical protein [Halobacteriales archaeon]